MLIRKIIFFISLLFHCVLGYSQVQQIYIQSPAKYEVSDTALHISCQISSPLDVSEVKAKVGSKEITLQRIVVSFKGDLSLVGMDQDTLTLTITVTDIAGTTFSNSVDFIYDSKPLILFEKSLDTLDTEVAMPFLEMKVKCEELNGSPCNLSIQVKNALGFHILQRLEFSNVADTILDLSQLNGFDAEVKVSAKDNRNQVTTVAFIIPVETSPFLQEVRDFKDEIVTVKNGKVLVQKNGKLKICEVNSDFCEEVGFEGEFSEINVLDNGIAFIGNIGPGLSQKHVYTWYNDTLTQIDQDIPSPFTPLNVKSNEDQILIAGCEDSCGDGLALWAYNRHSQSIELITSVGDRGFAPDNGTSVLYNVSGPMHDLWRFEDGIHSKIISDAYITYPRIGNKMVYYKYNGALLAMFDGLTETVLHDAPIIGHYLVNGNFVIFHTAGNLGQSHVWTVDVVSGAKHQVTYFGNGSTSYVSNSNGEMILRNYGHGYDFYLASSKSIKRKIRISNRGKDFWDNGNWYTAIKNKLFLIDTVNYIKPSVSSLSKLTPYNQSFTFTQKEFEAAFSGDGILALVKITKLPDFGTLTLNGEQLSKDVEIPRWMLSAMQYVPVLDYSGTDNFNWSASNGYDYSPETEFTIEVSKPIVTKIEEPHTEAELVIYPNPATSSVSIKVENMGNARLVNTPLVLKNYLGKSFILNYRVENETIIADTGILIPGLYLMSIKIGNKHLTKKIIVTPP